MATQTPFVVQNENMHFHSGKVAGGAKVDVPKSEQKGKKIRKALADISKNGRAPLSTAAKASSLRERSVVHGNQKPKSIPNNLGLTEEEIQRCNEWAKEGIEHIHFSGNDLLALQKDFAEERINKKVEKVISALRGWTQMSYGFGRSREEFGDDPEDFMKLEPDPEVILPIIDVSFSTSDGNKFDDPFLGETHDVWSIPDSMFDLKLKEEYE